MSEVEREKNWRGWQKAITKSLDWVEEEDDDQFEDAIQDTPSNRRFSLKETSVGRRTTLKETGESRKAYVYNSFSLVLVAAVGMGAAFLLGRHHRK
jgi:hypothetical protein